MMIASPAEKTTVFGDITADPGVCYPKAHTDFPVAMKQLGVEEGSIKYVKAQVVYAELCSLYDSENPARVITTADIEVMLEGGFVIVGLTPTPSAGPNRMAPQRYEVFDIRNKEQNLVIHDAEAFAQSLASEGFMVQLRTVTDIKNANRAEILVNVLSRGNN